MHDFSKENFNDENSIDLKLELQKYLIHWRWFLLSVLITILLAFIYLKTTDKIYSVETTILIKEDNQSDLSSQLAAFSDLGLGGSKNNIENEIEVLKSRTLSEKVIDSLKNNYLYYTKDGVKKNPFFKNSPINLNFVPNNKKEIKTVEFEITNITSKNFDLTINEEELGKFNFDTDIKSDYGKVRIEKVNTFGNNFINSSENSETVYIEYAPIEKVSFNLRNQTNIAPTTKTSSVITISLKNSFPEQAAEYLNTLVQFYNYQGIEDKRFIAQHTSEFITNRLHIISEELGDVEKNVESYKNQNKLTDIQSEVSLFLTNLTAYERSVVENETEIKVVEELINHLRRSGSDELVPNILLNNNTSINSSIDNLNKLILDRQRQLINSTKDHPRIIELEASINSSKNNILSSLKNNLNSLKIAKNDLKRQENQMQIKLSEVPKQEREFRIIDRQQKVKEALYLFLLQKREETNITLAATELTAKVIDKAIVPIKPIGPKSLIILMAALVIGLLIPFLIIYIQLLLDTKVKSKLDLEKVSHIPFLGDVPTSETSDEVIELNSRSSSAEAIRIIRTNLEFMISDLDRDKCKLIFSTSTFPGEGKTFISANIAATFALSEKKTLLIGMDIRNPQLDAYFNLPSKGLTNYLSSTDTEIKDYIVSIPNYKHLDVLPAGAIPPNPAELLMSSKLEKLFDELKTKYDYIIVDTAPVSLVTDTLLIAKYADSFMYVIRAGKLDKKFLNIPESLYNENKLPRMCLLLNDTDTTKGYGYGYGYGVKKELKNIPIWKRILGIK